MVAAYVCVCVCVRDWLVRVCVCETVWWVCVCVCVCVGVDRRIRVYPNQKPWMTKEVKVLLKERSGAFRSGDEAQYRTARANLRRGIREAKTAYKRRIEDQFSSNNIRQVWQGVQHITNY